MRILRRRLAKHLRLGQDLRRSWDIDNSKEAENYFDFEMDCLCPETKSF